ncbi:RRXRR domain-containing protein, partial [uncultured Turicimonas sp.]
VLDRKGRSLMPCHPARARKLLKKGRARVAGYSYSWEGCPTPPRVET